MITRFQTIEPDRRLSDCITRIFILETSGRMPTEDLKLIVPNSCPKIVIPFKNGLWAKSRYYSRLSLENRIAFIGSADSSATVDYQHDGPAGNITVEFSPMGAYRFFNLLWSDVTNDVLEFSEIESLTAGELEEKLADIPGLEDKVQLVQQFLLKRLISRPVDPVFEYCVRQIQQSGGAIPLRQLEKYTGYSARWLNIKFHQHIGLSPKNLASVIRFQQYYHALVNNAQGFFRQKRFYDYYYDQNHFIKDFKRFTGHPPLFFSRSSNAYDSAFYRE